MFFIIRLINIDVLVSVIDSLICQVEWVIIWICIGMVMFSRLSDRIEIK